MFWTLTNLRAFVSCSCTSWIHVIWAVEHACAYCCEFIRWCKSWASKSCHSPPYKHVAVSIVKLTSVHQVVHRKWCQLFSNKSTNRKYRISSHNVVDLTSAVISVKYLILCDLHSPMSPFLSILTIVFIVLYYYLLIECICGPVLGPHNCLFMWEKPLSKNNIKKHVQYTDISWLSLVTNGWNLGLNSWTRSW